MSRTELHYGRFQVVAKGINEMKQYAKENDLENKLEFDEYDENRCYCFIETSDGYEAVYVNGEWQLIKYLKHIETDDEELDAFLQNDCNIIQDPGFWFGENGKGFTRLNVACPRVVLEKSIVELRKQILKRV